MFKRVSGRKAAEWAWTNRYPIFWSAWFSSAVFVDVHAVRRGRFEDTLTHRSRVLTGVNPNNHPLRRSTGQAIVAGLAWWAFHHIALGPHNDSPIHRALVSMLYPEAFAEQSGAEAIR